MEKSVLGNLEGVSLPLCWLWSFPGVAMAALCIKSEGWKKLLVSFLASSSLLILEAQVLTGVSDGPWALQEANRNVELSWPPAFLLYGKLECIKICRWCDKSWYSRKLPNCSCKVINDVYHPHIPAQQIVLVFLFIILLVPPPRIWMFLFIWTLLKTLIPVTAFLW